MRHIPMYDDGHWICLACDFVTDDDHEALRHYSTGMEQILDELGVPD